MPKEPWKKPNACPLCGGTGLVVRQVQAAIYECGWTTEARMCLPCRGTGTVSPLPVDHKLVAAGGAQ